MSVTKEELDRYNAAYMQGNPKISDEEYDRLQEEYVNEHGEESRLYTRSIQTGAVSDLVNTLTKTYGVIETMRPEQKSYKNWVESNGFDTNTKIIVQPKFDGCSIAFDSKEKRFFKRGDYDNGESEEVTNIFDKHQFLDRSRVEEMCDGCKFEMIMGDAVYQEGYKNYETPRDAAVSYMRRCQSDTEYDSQNSFFILTLIPLRELVDGKQYVAPFLKQLSLETTVDDYESIQRFINDLLSNGASVDVNMVWNDRVSRADNYKCDGVVVSVINEDDSIRKEVAIKILHDVHDAKLIDIEYQIGNTGKITPVAKIAPTLFADGKRTVTSITLSTLDRVKKMNLRHNDTVCVMYNIVPYLIDSKHDGDLPIVLPTKCPICGYKLDLNHLKTVRCMNPNCTGRRIGDITRYVIKMRMLGISKATISTLYDAGLVTKISDLYRLTKEKIMSLDGYKDKSAENILNTIKRASQDCPVSRWLGALPFKDVDSKTWDIILNQSFGNDELRKGNMIKGYLDMEGPEEFIYEIMTQWFPGIGDAKTRAINEGWMKHFKEMQDIIDHISFRITTVSKPNVQIQGRVTFTGCRDEELSKSLLEKGYETIDFSSKTDILIIPNKEYNNSKTAKAKVKGIKIYTIDEVKNGAI